MTVLEQVMVKMGIDDSAIAAGVRKVTQTFINAAHSITNSFKEAFTHLAAPLSVGGLVVVFDKVLQRVEKIKAVSEALGTSTKFVQDIQNAGMQSALSAEQVNLMLEKFVKFLPAGADVEQSFYKIADRIASVKDPAERARLAIEAFGKSGVQMVPMLTEGAAGVKKLADSFKTLSEEEIRAVDAAKSKIEQTQNAVTVFIGKRIENVQWAFKYYKNLLLRSDTFGEAMDITLSETPHDPGPRSKRVGEMREELANRARDALKSYNEHLDNLRLKSGDASEKLAILSRRWNEAAEEAAKAAKARDPIGEGKAFEKMASLEQEAADIQKKAAEDQKRADDARVRRAQDVLKIDRDIAALRQQQASEPLQSGLREVTPGWQEMANSRGPFAMLARRFLALQADARAQMLMPGGSKGRLDADVREFTRLRGMFEDAVGLETPTAKIEKHIADLVQQRTALLIKPIEGT